MKAIVVTPRIKEVKIINQAEPNLVSPTDVKLRMLDCPRKTGPTKTWRANSGSTSSTLRMR